MPKRQYGGAMAARLAARRAAPRAERRDEPRKRGLGASVAAAAAACVVAVAVATLVGCGYQVVRSDAPFGRSAISVVPFVEPKAIGISAPLADAVSRLLAAGGVRLVRSRAAADAALEGEVLAESTRGSPTSGVAAPIPAYLLSVTVQARLVDPRGRVLWQTTVAAAEDFLSPSGDVTDAALAIEASRRSALHRVAERLARELHDQLILSGSTDAQLSAPPLTARLSAPPT